MSHKLTFSGLFNYGQTDWKILKTEGFKYTNLEKLADNKNVTFNIYYLHTIRRELYKAVKLCDSEVL